jgi:serine/threonine-protein kinase
MSLVAGTCLGAYEITGTLGAGGMGEVYRARDTRLKREVALKVLPDSFAADPERLARFQREAEVLASLNHPNIAAIYGLEEADGIRALVLELVEGPTLAELIERAAQGREPARGLPIAEALAIATQIADALEAAHEQGIVHRDLKPANVKVRDDGTVKVLDFGLAKAMEIAAPTLGGGSPTYIPLTQAPTITTPAMTHAGVILGTAAYMAPEQAKGKAVDKRADIWAFGCVLFEMLTGRQVFAGETVTETLAEVMKSEPPWEALPAGLPASVMLALRRCLEKNPTMRMRDIGDVRLALAGSFDVPSRQTAEPPVVVRDAWRAAAVAVGSLVVGAAVTALILPRLATPTPGVPTRFTVAFPGGEVSPVGPPRIDISDDGRMIVYGGRGMLYRRSLGDLAEEPIRGTDGGTDPRISPDGQWILFGRTPGDVFKVPAAGGTVMPIVKGPVRGTSWAENDSLVLGWIRGGLSRISANGGEPVPLTRLKPGEIGHRWPDVIPETDSVVFTVWSETAARYQIAVASLSSGEHRVLLDGMYGRFISGGHIVFARNGSIWTVPFDAERQDVNGLAVSLVTDIPVTEDGAAQFAIASNGTLVYDPAQDSLPRRSLVWVDPRGRESVIPAPERAYLYPRVSPDGAHIVVTADDQERDLWIWDLSRATFTRATFGPGRDLFPTWTRDGRRIVFGSEVEEGQRNLFWRAADGTGVVERLSESRYSQNPTAITADGRAIIYTEQTEDGGDILQVELPDRDQSAPSPSSTTGGAPPARAVRPLVRSQFAERNAALSPDGRWLAYEANDSGGFEVYVRPYPDVEDGRWQASLDGGSRPVWARSGQELFFASPDGAVIRVGVEPGPSWRATPPSVVIAEGY